MYKYIYEILPTNHRLAQIRIRNDPLCEHCSLDDTNIHKFYHCGMIQECIQLLRKVLFYIGGLQTTSLLKILYLDIPKIDKRNMNSICVIISCYISTVWFNRSDLRYIKNVVKANIVKMQKFHRIALEVTWKESSLRNIVILTWELLIIFDNKINKNALWRLRLKLAKSW